VGHVQTHFGVPQQLGAFAGSTTLLSGHAGTAQTVSLAKKLVDAAVKDPEVNALAISIIRPTPQYDRMSKAEAIFHWTRANMYYIEDPVGPYGPKETLRPMRDLMVLRAGDCDDINMVFLPSLLGTIGIQSRVVTVKADEAAPSEFSHVYCEALIDDDWIPMDCARPGANFGEAPPYYWDRKEWPINFEQPFTLMGMGCADGRCGCAGKCGQPARGATGQVARGLSGIVRRFPSRTMGDSGSQQYDANGNLISSSDSTLAQDISSASIGAASVISAANQNPYSYLSTTNASGVAPQNLAYSTQETELQLESWLPFIIGFIVLMELAGGGRR
jgi:hypothetical protein